MNTTDIRRFLKIDPASRIMLLITPLIKTLGIINIFYFKVNWSFLMIQSNFYLMVLLMDITQPYSLMELRAQGRLTRKIKILIKIKKKILFLFYLITYKKIKFFNQNARNRRPRRNNGPHFKGTF